MTVERFAGSAILDTMMAENKKNTELMKQLQIESQRKIAEQTRRDMAAAYGKVIPFT